MANTTRAALHAVAEQVLARARWEAVGRIGLEPTPGGFGTPAFPAGAATARVVRVDGTDVVVSDDGVERRAPLSTLAAAAAFVGTPLGAPPGVYPAATEWAADEPLGVDPPTAAGIAAWYGDGAVALAALAASADSGDDPTAATLWPEHFDLGLAAGAEGARANYGISPGDAGVPEPYAYVGPWDAARATDPAGAASADRAGSGGRGGAYWNATSFPGAVLLASSLPAERDARVAAILAFFREGRARLLT